MRGVTHKLIADMVYEYLIKKYDIKIDYYNLIRGSTAPDSYPSMVVIPHIISKSGNILKKNIEKLCSFGKPGNTSVKEFSFRLGIILHYISDYFCTAHNNKKYINPLIHLIYENKLKQYYEKNISHWEKIVLSDCQTENLMEHISSKHMQYMQFNKSLNNDFLYSMELVLEVASSIMSKLVKSDNSKLLLKTFNSLNVPA